MHASPLFVMHSSYTQTAAEATLSPKPGSSQTHFQSPDTFGDGSGSTQSCPVRQVTELAMQSLRAERVVGVVDPLLNNALCKKRSS